MNVPESHRGAVRADARGAPGVQRMPRLANDSEPAAPAHPAAPHCTPWGEVQSAALHPMHPQPFRAGCRGAMRAGVARTSVLDPELLLGSTQKTRARHDSVPLHLRLEVHGELLQLDEMMRLKRPGQERDLSAYAPRAEHLDGGCCVGEGAQPLSVGGSDLFVLGHASEDLKHVNVRLQPLRPKPTDVLASGLNPGTQQSEKCRAQSSDKKREERFDSHGSEGTGCHESTHRAGRIRPKIGRPPRVRALSSLMTGQEGRAEIVPLTRANATALALSHTCSHARGVSSPEPRTEQHS